MTATRITVDGITYRVLVEYDSLKRSFTLMEGGNEGTAISGRSIRDILGTVYSYEMTVRADPDYPTDYDSFYYKISEPIDYHRVALPFGQSVLRFNAKISEGGDVYKGYYKRSRHWDELEVKFDSMAPQRIDIQEDIVSSAIDIITPSFSSLPQTFYSDYIFADHTIIENSVVLSNPDAMGSNWTIVCTDTTITISGEFVSGNSTTLSASLRVPSKTLTVSKNSSYNDYDIPILVYDVDVVTPSFSSLPQTFYSKYIKSTMQMIDNSVVLSNPDAMGTAWNVTCYDGYLTINGTMVPGKSTTAKMSLREPPINVTLSESPDNETGDETVQSLDIDVVTPSFDSLPKTFYSRYITVDHVMIDNSATFSNADALGNNWKVTCYDGYLTITGSVQHSQATNIKMSLRRQRRQVTVAKSL